MNFKLLIITALFSSVNSGSSSSSDENQSNDFLGQFDAEDMEALKVNARPISKNMSISHGTIIDTGKDEPLLLRMDPTPSEYNPWQTTLEILKKYQDCESIEINVGMKMFSSAKESLEKHRFKTDPFPYERALTSLAREVIEVLQIETPLPNQITTVWHKLYALDFLFYLKTCPHTKENFNSFSENESLVLRLIQLKNNIHFEDQWRFDKDRLKRAIKHLKHCG